MKVVPVQRAPTTGTADTDLIENSRVGVAAQASHGPNCN